MSRGLSQQIFDDEVRDIIRKIASVTLCDYDKNVLTEEEIYDKLLRLHCPFTWKPYNEENCRDVLTTIENKLSNLEDEGEEFTAWTTFVLNLILCYEYATKGAVDFALEKQEECDNIVAHAIESGFSVPVMGIGLKHVSDACKIFLLMKSEQLDKAVNVLHKIADVKEMQSKDQASIWCVRGAVYLEYGLKGMKESIQFIEKALEFDSECGEWHFLLGKALSRVRRLERSDAIPEKRELKALEKAVSMSDNTFYMVLLAQSYTDTSQKIYRNKRNSSDIQPLCDELNSKALEMYKTAYNKCGNNPYVLGRCAYGFLKLPHPWRDEKMALNCALKGLEKHSTNSSLNYAAALVYQNQKEMDKAKVYFAFSAENGCFSACIQLVNIKQRENKLYNPVADLERYIELFKEKQQQEHLLTLLGAFYYFVKNDFNTALLYWSRVIHSDIESGELKALFNKWHGAPNPCNVSKTIINEIIRRLDEGCNEEEKIMYEEILEKYKKHHTALVKSIQGVYSERSRYKSYCASEDIAVPSSSHVWHSATRNSVGNFWKVRPASQCAMRNEWRKKSSK